jgi:hypothetical protein
LESKRRKKYSKTLVQKKAIAEHRSFSLQNAFSIAIFDLSFIFFMFGNRRTFLAHPLAVHLVKGLRPLVLCTPLRSYSLLLFFEQTSSKQNLTNRMSDIFSRIFVPLE